MFEYYFVIGYTSLHIFNFCVLFIMHCTLTIPEILENIFTFLSRKKLYKSCTRVNQQWNAVSTFIIQKKRKNELINITNIRDNIFFHLYFNDAYSIEFVNYCVVNKIWEKKFKEIDGKYTYFIFLRRYDHEFNTGNNLLAAHSSINRRTLKQTRTRLKDTMYDSNSPKYIKCDSYLKRYYNYIRSNFNIRIEFLRLAKSFHIYDTPHNTQDEFLRLTRVYRSIY